eukprot:652869-Prorocentrum_minimum.AAC.1
MQGVSAHVPDSGRLRRDCATQRGAGLVVQTASSILSFDKSTPRGCSLTTRAERFTAFGTSTTRFSVYLDGGHGLHRPRRCDTIVTPDPHRTR